MVKIRNIKSWSLWVVMFLAVIASVSGVKYFLDEDSAVGYKNKNSDFVFTIESTEVTEVEWDTENNFLHVCWKSHYTRNGEDRGHNSCMQIHKSLSVDEQRRLVYQAAQKAFEADKGIEKVVVAYETHPLLDTPNKALNKIIKIQNLGKSITTKNNSYGTENTDLSLKIAEIENENELLKYELCRKDNTYSWCSAEQTLEEWTEPEPVVEPELPAEPVNNVPIIESFNPSQENISLHISESQDFAITVSDADGDELSSQWFINNIPLTGQNSTSFTFTADETGSFEVKVLVTDNKDYTAKKWFVTATEEQAQGFSITGASVVASQGSYSLNELWNWMTNLF